MPTTISVRFEQELHDKLLDKAQDCGMSLSEFIRAAVDEKITRGLDIFNPIRDLLDTLEKQAPEKKTKKKRVSQADRHLLSVWREVYEVPKRSRVFWPPILNVLASIRKEGFSDEEIEELIRISPEHGWIGSRAAQGDVPPLHQVLSQKVVASLVEMAEQRSRAELVEDAQELPLYKTKAIRDVKDLLKPRNEGDFYSAMDVAQTKDEVDKAVFDLCDEVNKHAEEVIRGEAT
jgi:hypothetical protein